MDKASKVIRRSSVRLRSIGGGHSDLNMVISELTDMKQAAKAFTTAQNSVAQDMLKWSSNEENRALQDCITQISELNNIWTDVQKIFIHEIKCLRHQFEMVLEDESQLDNARSNLISCEQKEVKCRKDVKRAFKKAPFEELDDLEAKLNQAEIAKDNAQTELVERTSEAEAVKLIRLKTGLTKITDAYIEMANKCCLIFEAQKDVIHQLPDVEGKDLHEIKYTGTGITKLTVNKAKDQVQEYKQKAYKLVPSTYPTNEPPPPYTPGFFNPATGQSFPADLYPSTHQRQRATAPSCPIYQDLPPTQEIEDISGAMAASHI